MELHIFYTNGKYEKISNIKLINFMYRTNKIYYQIDNDGKVWGLISLREILSYQIAYCN